MLYGPDVSLGLIFHLGLKKVRLKSAHDTDDQQSGTPNGAQSSHNTKDRNNRHPITPKLIIITTYFKSTITPHRSSGG
jgi:hypothetical protein